MRIAITADPFIPVPPINYGGIERVIHFLADGLVKNGHDVILVAHKDSKVAAELIKYPSVEAGTLNHLKNVATINQLKKWKPDIIHSFSRLAYLLPFFRSSIPKLMSYQREPTIAQIKKAVKWSKKSSLAFTGCSNYISQQISPYAQSFTVYNGIDLNIYDFKAEISSTAPLVFLGRIEPIKGTHIAIKAALETGKDLFIAGNIPPEYQHYFETEIKPFLSSQINYVGPVNDVQKNEILGLSAAFLMPIEWNEPFGIVMAEALACGTPVIGYRRGSVPEVVQHGINGYIAEDFKALCTYIEKSSELSRIKTRETAVNNFSSIKIIEDYTQIYQKLTHQP